MHHLTNTQARFSGDSFPPPLGFMVAAVAAVAAVALGVASLAPDAGTKVQVEPADRLPQPPGGNESDKPDSGAEGPAPLPETFLAVRDHGTELIVVETATGRVVRTLVDLGDPPDDEIDRSLHGFIDGVTLASNGDSVYYGIGPEPVTGNRHRVGIDGRGDTRVGAGFFPVAGFRDGDLAWLTIDGIMVDRAGAGAELFEARGGPEPAVGASDLAWAPNSDQLAYVESSHQGPVSIRVLDLSSGANSLDDSREVPGTGGREFFSPSYRASDGLLGVLEACCREEAGSVSATTFVLFDPDTGAVVERVDLPFKATG